MAVERWTRRPLRSRNTAWAARLARLLVQAHVRPNQILLASLAAAAATTVTWLVPLTLSLGGTSGTQTLYIAVGN